MQGWAVALIVIGTLIVVTLAILLPLLLIKDDENGTPITSPVTSPSQPSMDPTPAQQFALDNNFVHGVGFGGWMVIENSETDDFMFDQPFMKNKSQLDWINTNRAARDDEFAKTAQTNHWKGYIPDALLDDLAEIGIVSVRLAVGYWCFEAPVGSTDVFEVGFQEEGFITGALTFIEEMLEKLFDRNITVMIDLHSLPGGSTACQSYAGILGGESPSFWTGNPPLISKCMSGAMYSGSRSAAQTWEQVGEGFFVIIANWIVSQNAKFGQNVITDFEIVNEPSLNNTTPGIREKVFDLYFRNVRPIQDILANSVGGPVNVVLNFISENYAGSGAWMRDNIDSGKFTNALAADQHSYFNFGIDNSNADFWLNEVCTSTCCADYTTEYLDPANNIPLSVSEWSCAFSQNNPKLSCFGTSDDGMPGIDFLTAVYSNQVSNFFRLSKTTSMKGSHYWSCRVGSGWDPQPTGDFPNGRQIPGTAYNQSLDNYPFCSWNWAELKRLGVIQPLDQMGLEVSSQCECNECKSSFP